MTPLVTVILPVYNNEKTIISSINSILNQTYTDFELIVINDGSTDKTGTILTTINDPRLVVMGSTENFGLPKRLNQAISAARGHYIARMDADDLSFPDRLEKQVNFLNANPEIDLIATRAIVFDDTGKILGLLPFYQDHKDIIKSPWNAIPLPHPTWMTRKDWIKKYGYAVPEIWRAEDQDLLLRAHQHSKYACLPDIALCYRQHRFDYKKTVLARCNLLRAQTEYFWSQKNFSYLCFSLASFIVKSITDLYFYCLGKIKPVTKNNFNHNIPENYLEQAKKMVSQ